MPALVHISASSARDKLTPMGPRVGADAGDPQIRQLPVETGTGAKVGIWECTRAATGWTWRRPALVSAT